MHGFSFTGDGKYGCFFSLGQGRFIRSERFDSELMANRILIITGDDSDAKTLQDVLEKSADGFWAVERVRRLSEGVNRLAEGGIDAIMVDLLLPDSRGIDTFDQVSAAAPHTPILTLNGVIDERLTTEAVQHGAQGYLAKDHFGSYLVPQSLKHILQRKAVEERFFIERTRAEITLNSISDAVITTDMSGNVDYLNASAEIMTGWTRDEARGRPITEVMRIINSATRMAERNPAKMVLQQDKPMGLTAGTLLVHRHGREAAIEDSAAPIHDWNGKISGAVIVFHDITAAQAMSKKMAYLAQHDFLTDLPNRVLLDDRITQAIALAKRRRGLLAVLFLDLDNFKHVNDSLGHAIGDALLQSVAKTLTGCVRKSDTVSRQGGDEFVILVTESKNAAKVAVTASKILTALLLPHSAAGNELYVTTSIGISVYPEDGQDAETLLKNADTAMYYAKEKGRNNYQFFESEMNARAVERQSIEMHLRRALELRELELYYQPKVHLASGKITGAEALIRWIHPQWGMLLPGRFVPVAEDCGLIVPIGRWVLRQACLQAKKWQGAGWLKLPVAVNISSLEFRHKDFVCQVQDIIKETELAPRMLQLEMSESALMDDVPSSTEILKKLNKMGVQLAVDDFGTGYSSLNYLKQFPVDVLKIDQSFIQDIGKVNGDGIIVGAVIAMGKNMKMLVVAEGIENQEQLAFLKRYHCQEGQGFFFSPPLTARKFTEILETGVEK